MKSAEFEEKPREVIYNFRALEESLAPEERICAILDAPPLELTWTVASSGIRTQGEICNPEGKISICDIPDGCSGYHPRIAQLLNNDDLCHKLWRIDIYRHCVRLHYYCVVEKKTELAAERAATGDDESIVSQGAPTKDKRKKTAADGREIPCLHSSIVTIDTSRTCYFGMFVKIKSFAGYPERHRLCEYTYDPKRYCMMCTLADIDLRRYSTKSRDTFLCCG